MVLSLPIMVTTGKLLVLLGSVLAASAGTISDMGPCTMNLPKMSYFDVKAFVNEGIWKYCFVPDADSWKNVTSVFMYQEAITNTSVCRAQVFRQSHCKEPEVFSDQVRWYYEDGRALARSYYATFEFTIKFYAYKKSKYACFYICSSDGGDTEIDYRFCLAHGSLSKKDIRYILHLDRKYGFRGTLKYICGDCHHARQHRYEHCKCASDH